MAPAQHMLDVLGADGPLAEYSAKLMLYGQFVGAWDGTVIVYRHDGTRREETCEVYFGWVLEGRAIQDVWIGRARADRAHANRDTTTDTYGTTIRVYDPAGDIWQITWVDPASQAFNRMTGRQRGDDIVQEYQDDDGTLWQWCFTEITSDSLRWIARESHDEGASWQLRNELFLKRRGGE